MKTFLSSCLLLCLSGIYAQQTSALLVQADSLYNLRQFEKCGLRYEAAFNSDIGEIPEEAFYKTAVSFSQSKQPAKAVFYLQKGVDQGIDDEYLTDIRFDISFNPIKYSEEWKKFLAKNIGKFDQEAKNISHAGIRQEL